MSYIEQIMKAHPDWPRRIRHGDYVGHLSGSQPLLDGDAAPLYRFPGGECVGVDFEVSAVRTAPSEDGEGIIHCGCCDAELWCDRNGDMPDVCPVCHEGIDWASWGGDYGPAL